MGEENKVVGEGEKKKKESVGAIAVVGDGEEEKNKKKKKSKKQGLISRMWNGIFRRRSDDFEKWLQYISKEEAVVMARTSILNRIPSLTALLKLPRPLAFLAWNLSSLLLLELPSSSSWGYGFMVKYNTYLRKQRGLQRLKLGLDQQMLPWMNDSRSGTAYAQSNANKSKKKK
ncbi:hypothetical protein HN51_005732 [Arachis hypogaea]